ncbi:MAG: sulfopyruvate decarboxylase subunit alpha [Candidatus Komeilibacteria bacterium CG_4_9_14_0_8_um_filter_36_9]|uniref:Sulfopyruvate decarboxylase subunit alpha n=2 Tax=Candidatus Komeiliibacteriota TaxID=1817908 RepID=A0A2M8DRW5_9BACT|nr:MAG: sulfopyruvate decarboxylase subunit alpha [Candidatus Komeilibacteria bacterium CG_4_10_14_0_8_um_filter_37_78]PJC02111.1 MAG: sulfopyruvate decarboxylase subunit alpha [Candidatus Komeilibacteria bacterium CG_4_9_14_0_8_um_filter_36_9]
MHNETAFNTLDSERSEKADQMHRLFLELGVDFATGVPCGVLRYIIQNFDDDVKILHILANRESEAVGIAAGAYFAGKTPVVYMQNSGLFAASNDVASLLVPYEIPIFFVVSYRGCEGEDAIQHLTTGRATEALLQSLGLSFVVFDGHDLTTLIGSMFKEMYKSKLPTILLLKRGWQR